MKVRIDYFCKPRLKSAPYDLENIYMDVDLPFVPTAGMMLKVTAEGDYLEVADVMLDLSPGGEGLAVGIKEPPGSGDRLLSWKEARAEGWKASHA